MTDMWAGLRKAILSRRNAYRHTFMPDGQMTAASAGVMADLRRFCRATSTPAVVSFVSQTVDPIATGIAIGRQEVWHRIAMHLHLSDADLYELVEKQDGTD